MRIAQTLYGYFLLATSNLASTVFENVVRARVEDFWGT